MQRNARHKPVRIALGLCLLALSAQGGAAQTVEQFYKGKTINFLVASVPGGINDLMARLIARHLGKHIPGNPTLVVQNLQSSGLALVNRIYNTPEKDGLLIAIVERGAPQLAIMGDPNARFDPLKMTWLGSVSSYGNDAYSLSVNSTFSAKTVDDLARPTGRPPRSARPARARPTASSPTSPRMCSTSTSRTCAAIAAPPTSFSRSSATRSTARSSASPRSRSGSRRSSRPARSGR